jgi:hypothetical protein
MDYAPGTALAAVQLLLPAVDVDTALNWTRQTAVGLQALHAANLMHGDLCLENLYLKEDGQIWLLGLSVPVADMTPQANIKNVGQILYSLLMGQVWTPDAPPLPNTIPNEVTALAERCLEASDADLATITAVIAAIDEAIATKSVTVAAPVVETAVVPPPHRRSFVKPLVATVLAVILFAVTSFIFWPRQREESIPNALPSPRELGLTSTTRLSETATVAGLPTAAAVLATPTLAAPTAPISGSGPIHVALIEYNPDGDDALGEYIVVENRGETAVDLSNWRLEDSASRAHIFPFPNMMLAPGAQVKIWTGRGADTEDELYWGFGSAIWNNDGDTATLYDNTGTAVDSCSYPGGGIRAECP